MTVGEWLRKKSYLEHRKILSGVYGCVVFDDSINLDSSYTRFDDVNGVVTGHFGIADIWYMDKQFDELTLMERDCLVIAELLLEHEKRHVEQMQSLFQHHGVDAEMLKDFIVSRENPAYGSRMYWFDLCELDAYRESAVRAVASSVSAFGSKARRRCEALVASFYAAENNGSGMTLAPFVGFDDMLDKLQKTMDAYRGLVGIERCSVASLGNDLVARFARGLENRDLRLQSTMSSPSDAARQRDLLAGMACAVNPTYAEWFRVVDTDAMGTQFASAREWYSAIMPESLREEHERHAHDVERTRGIRVANVLGNIVESVPGVSNIVGKTYDLQL